MFEVLFSGTDFSEKVENGGLCTPVFHGTGLTLVTFPDELKIEYSAAVNEDSEEILFIPADHPVSLFAERDFSVRVFRKDGTPLLPEDPALALFSVSRFSRTVSPSFDVVLAASDSRTFYKEKADLVLDGTNDTMILAALFGCHDSIHVLLYGGHYRIDRMWTCFPDTKAALAFNAYLFRSPGQRRRYLTFEGAAPTCPQEEGGVRLCVAPELHESLKTDGEQYFLIGDPYPMGEKITKSATSVCLKNFNIIGQKYDKPITYIDTTRCLSTMIDSVNVRSWSKKIHNYFEFDEMPHPECCGIRVGRGSDYGIQNYVKHSNYWFCGKGFACNGEHFIIEDVKCHHDAIGFVFGDRLTVGRFEHPNILLGCSVEGCRRIMLLSKNGITEEGDFVKDYENFRQHSTLIAIGTSTEGLWTLPKNEQEEGKPTRRRSLPIKEVLKGCFQGRMEIDGFGFEDDGSGKYIDLTTYPANAAARFLKKEN